MTRKTNKEKILEYLEENPKSIATTELANAIDIDVKNISRYLKALEQEEKINRETKQIGKLRLVNISLKEEKEKSSLEITKKPKIKQTNQKTDILTTTRSKEITIPKKSKIQAKSIKNNNVLTISQKREYLAPKLIEEMGKEISLFGRTVPPDKKQEIINWVFKNIVHLYDGVFYYLRVWKKRNEKYKKESPDSPVLPKYQKMQELLDYIKELQNLKKELEITKIKKGT